MATKTKNKEFQLDPEWIYQDPIDFEHKKYKLLAYLQKCDKRFDELKIYPDFVELSLHLANLQSISKENTMLTTKKKFKSCDDEILFKELIPKMFFVIDSDFDSEEKELIKIFTDTNMNLEYRDRKMNVFWMKHKENNPAIIFSKESLQDYNFMIKRTDGLNFYIYM